MRIVDRGLVLLALRRSLAPGVVAWTICVLAFTLFAGSGSHGTPPSGTSLDETLPYGSLDLVAAGLARESVWYAFVLGVVPLLVVRCVSSVVPWRIMPDAAGRRGASQVAASRHGDAPWLATRAVSNATIATSTWLGAAIACVVLTVVFAVAAGIRGGSAPTPVAAGTLDGPKARWAATGSPLAWHAELPSGRFAGDMNTATNTATNTGLTARIELGLGAGTGAAAEVELRARRGAATTAATTRIGNRGSIEVALPPGIGGVDFELACKGQDTRVCVLSDSVELWSLPSANDSAPHPAATHAADLALLARFVLALCAWLALAIGVSRFVSPATAALAVLAAWVPHWWAEAGPSAFSSRWLPGVDLFDALSIVGDGRAPACPPLTSVAGTLVVVVISIVLACIGLRSWRVPR